MQDVLLIYADESFEVDPRPSEAEVEERAELEETGPVAAERPVSRDAR